MKDQYDVVIIGGGSAGLSAAVILSRSRRSVLVIDSGEPRNAPASAVHNYLGRENTPPRDLLAIGREELAQYGGELVSGTAVSCKKHSGTIGFTVALQDGREVAARRLLVTTGLADELPAIAGLAGRWGRDVLHCAYCHGWEVRDQTIGVLGGGPMGPFQALLFRQLSPDVTLFLDDGAELTADECEQLAARDISVVEGKVAGVEIHDDALSGVQLSTGDVIPCQALVVSPMVTARAGVLEFLGIRAEPVEMAGHVIGSTVPADPSGATAVPGVWVAGNIADVRAQVLSSAAAGASAGAAINVDLVGEDAQVAVALERLPAADAAR